MLGISRFIDRMNTLIGRAAAWLIIASVVISAINAVSRWGLDIASNKALEAQWQLFATTFLFCAPWTLILNEHIRIDIIASRLTQTYRNWVDLLGHLFFLLPFCALIIYTSLPYALNSLAINEQSLNVAGLPQWPSKFLIPIGFSLLFAQGISEIIKRIAVMRGRIPEFHTNTAHAAADFAPSDGAKQ